MGRNRLWILGAVAGMLAAPSGGAWAVPPPPTSLNTCQNAVQTATKVFITNKVAAIGTCLQAVSTQIVKKNAGNANAAAGTCVTQFRKLNDSRALGKQLSDKLATAIGKKCTPGQMGVTHVLADVLGAGVSVPEGLKAQDLNTWCTHFGGDGSIDTVPEWAACLAAAAECSVDAAIATQYPRALEWLALVKPAMQALPPPAADSSKISDAVAGLDAVDAAIDGPDNDGVVSMTCGGNGVPTPRYVDHGDGTVTDTLTGLMWEKKTDDGSIHDKDNYYPWSNSGTNPDGAAFTTFLRTLNNCASSNGVTITGGFAGHCDWRLPTIVELQTILLAPYPCGTNPCIDQTVFGPTQSGYWSSTAGGPGFAWLVDFGGGAVYPNGTGTVVYVRAVRGGSV